MTVADSGPYKSRFFNFISQTTQKLTDEGSRTWRYVKFATEIVLQTALYPVYFLFQTVRVTHHQLGTAIKQHFPQLNSTVDSKTPQSVNLDAPVVQSLDQVITPAKSEAENLGELEIEGIASQLDSQTLVIVQNDNIILDNLTLEAQPQFQLSQNLELTSFPPLRWFEQIMGWVQTSPIAVKINRFGESHVTEAVTFPIPSPEFIKSLDGAIAQVEDYSIIPISQVTHRLVTQSQTFGKTMVQVWQKPTQPDLSTCSNSSLERGVDEYFYKIQCLILAAIDYFFVDRQATISSEDISEPTSGIITGTKSNASPQLTSVEDPWLTADELTHTILSKLKTTKPSLSQKTIKSPPQPLTHPGQGSGKKRVLQKVESSFRPVTSEKTAITPPTSSATSQKPLTKTNSCVIDSSEIAIASPSASSPESQPNWLDAKVTSTGYIKHPLEKILEWLDHMMVKVEAAIFKAWYWLTHYEEN